jgi:hypothetical protein
MNISVQTEAKAEKVKITAKELIVDLVDGRRVEVPLVWFPRLLQAKPSQRNKYRLIGDGIGIHWSGIDEDLSVEGLMQV